MGLKSKEESLSLPTPSCQALLSTCLPIPSALSQTAHTSSLPNWTERSPPNRALYRYIYRFICHAIREEEKKRRREEEKKRRREEEKKRRREEEEKKRRR